MGSSASFLLRGGELIYIELRKTKNKCMADEQFNQANNKRNITKTKRKQRKKQTTTVTTTTTQKYKQSLRNSRNKL